MFSSQRLLVATLATTFALTSGVTPVAANDPAADAPSDEPDGSGAVGSSPHYESLQAYEGEAFRFSAGAAPTALAAPSSGGTMSLDGGAGSIAALPNGLTHEVFGYLPYWMLSAGDLANMRYDLVSTIAYFGVPARADGTLALGTTEGLGWTSSAMSGVISAAHQRGVRVVLTVTMMAWNGDYSAMTNVLTSSSRRAKLVNAIAATLKDRRADGVNIDFEPVPSSLRNQFSTFITELKAGLKAQGAGSYVTVATMAGAATWSTGYDVAALTAKGAADALMVMAYDFHYAGSARAGAVAPHSSPYVFDAGTALADHLRLVPASKLIWGVPYYGRAWTTQSKVLNSLTCKSTSICPSAKAGAIGRSWAPTYGLALEAAATYGRRWDAAGEVPWYRYQSSTYGTWVQGYYDDAESLGLKYDRARAHGLRGVGIWHLLMDGSHQALWDVLAQKFANPFTDIGDSKFYADILWVYRHGYLAGCSATRFCPKARLSRGQLASALAAHLSLPPAAKDYFSDDNGSVHEDAINRVRAANLMGGCGNRKFCLNQDMRRGPLARIMVRALNLPSTTRDHFTDDDGTRHEPYINSLASAGIALRCGVKRYCPGHRIMRQHAAVIFHRAFD